MASTTTATSARKAVAKRAPPRAAVAVLKPPEVDQTPSEASEAPSWMSPKEASDRVFDVSTGRADFRYAMLRRRRHDHANTLSELLQAKLQPREPTAEERAATGGWPVTARGHALVRARGAPDVQSLEQLADDFDARTVVDQKLLATVITIIFPNAARTGHELMTMGYTFCALHIAPRQLTSLAVLHVPCDVLSTRPPHLHLVVFSRTQGPLGWGVVDAGVEEDRHTHWAAQWDGFVQEWHEADP